MLATLRRIYYAIIIAGAMIFTTWILGNLTHEFFLRLGLVDYPGQALQYTTPDPANLTRALTFLIVDLVVVVPVGVLHWWLFRRDMVQDPEVRTGPVRQAFLSFLLAGYGLLIIFALMSTVSGIGNDAAVQEAVAIPLAVAVAGILTLAALLAENFSVRDPLHEESAILQSIFSYIAQWILTVTLVVSIQQLIQTTLQAVILPVHNCAVQFGPYSQCTSLPAIPGALLSLIIALLGWVTFYLWTRGQQNRGLWLANTVILTAISSITLTIFLVFAARFATDLLSGNAQAIFPGSLLSTPPLNTSGLKDYSITYNSYPFIGPVFAGAVVLAYSLMQQWRRPLPEGKAGRQLALVTLTLPFMIVFFIGAADFLGQTLLTLAGRGVSTDSWNGAYMFLLGGVPWVWLWPIFARQSNPHHSSVVLPRRVYVLISVILGLGAAVISLAIGLYITLANVLNIPVDSTGDSARIAFGVTLATGAGAVYYIAVLVRDSRILHQQHVTSPQVGGDAAPAPPHEVPTLERVLSDLVGGALTIEQAAWYLRQHPEVR